MLNKSTFSMKKFNGFSLIEMLVALVILSTGLIAIAGLQTKMLTEESAEFRKSPSTDEKTYPTTEAVPKFRQSARWECCWPEMARSRHHRPGNPRPIDAREPKRRNSADLPTCLPSLR